MLLLTQLAVTSGSSTASNPTPPVSLIWVLVTMVLGLGLESETDVVTNVGAGLGTSLKSGLDLVSGLDAGPDAE
jgi:hypothetical protein